jgi:hypothetical protein
MLLYLNKDLDWLLYSIAPEKRASCSGPGASAASKENGRFAHR